MNILRSLEVILVLLSFVGPNNGFDNDTDAAAMLNIDKEVYASILDIDYLEKLEIQHDFH